MTFQLDTTGRVECATSLQPLGWAIWNDLTPFTKGYIEALFADSWKELGSTHWLTTREVKDFGFSDLAPETLARIIADCEAWRRALERRRPAMFSADHGRQFWEGRNRVGWDWPRDFPPLTVQLGDDGKVRFAA